MGLLDRITGPLGGRDPDLLDGNLNRPLPSRPASEPAPKPEKPEKREKPPVDPKDFQPDELRYGFVVAGIIAVVAVLNMAVTTGRGAPHNPPYLLSGIGLALSAAVVGLLLARRRMLAPFAAVAAAFCVTYGRTPNSLEVPHFVAIIAPVVWAFWITQRSNKAMRAQRMEAARAKKEARQATRGQSGRQAGGRRGKKEPEPTGPAANRRYTPPKPRSRPAPAASEPAKRESTRSLFRRPKARRD
ncbi:MAG: hypothetical protein J2P57_08720 [Acidimicrobiaceae bacterium]|nr:hypothetical protein [Acidimicrobiaceae bacterium]